MCGNKIPTKAQNPLDLSLLLTNYCCSFNNNARQADKRPSLIYTFGTVDAYVTLSRSGRLSVGDDGQFGIDTDDGVCWCEDSKF